MKRQSIPLKAGQQARKEPVQSDVLQVPEEATSRLTVDLPARLHATMKVSCKKRKIPMAREVVQLLEWHYRGGPAVDPAADATEEIRKAEQDRAILGKSIEPTVKENGKTKEPMVRTAFSIPPTLHDVISVGAAGRRMKIADEVRTLLSQHYLGAASFD